MRQCCAKWLLHCQHLLAICLGTAKSLQLVQQGIRPPFSVKQCVRPPFSQSTMSLQPLVQQLGRTTLGTAVSAARNATINTSLSTSFALANTDAHAHAYAHAHTDAHANTNTTPTPNAVLLRIAL